jgi:hypothetical protein
MTPAELLTRLGTTADEVAATLRDLGIRGQRFDGCDCPVARYLADHGHEMAVGSVSAKSQWERVLLPHPVAHFAMAFDQGAYPELEVTP